MQPVQPILVVDLFPPLLEGLLALLDGLSEVDWDRLTACAGWSVKDVADHLLGGDLSMLSRRRDSYHLNVGDLSAWETLVQFINTWNRDWVTATRRLSPRVTRELLAWAGPQVSALFASQDPFALGGPVSWAGPDPAPVWLDLAREYTERWHHQQHIRDAVGRPGFTEPHFMAPVLDAFVRALPHTYRETPRPKARR
ncbi:MAG: maleylpyruvate isomerase family mycothiol-dependent enzyme [Anaerolineae bacterium]|nr:maleylpyruvate isomerase family mycothiol-dependent enzyme [Anaerolineae bacterium]